MAAIAAAIAAAVAIVAAAAIAAAAGAAAAAAAAAASPRAQLWLQFSVFLLSSAPCEGAAPFPFSPPSRV